MSSTSIRRRAGAVTVGALVGLWAGALAAQPSTDFDAVIAAAQAEGRLVMYGSPADSNLQQAAEAFEDSYGISVEFTRIPNGPLTQRVDAEIQAGQVAADVVVVSDIPWARRIGREGHAMNLEGIPAAADYPAQYWDPYTPGVTVVVPVLMYNTDLVPPDAVPTSWTDLLDPRWKGLIGITTVAAGLGAISVYDTVTEHFGDDFFSRLAENEPQIVASTSAASSQVASGELALLLPAYGYVTRPLMERGAPVDYTHFDITPVYTRSIFALERAAHPNAALLFVNWSLTPEGQEAWNGNFFGSATLPGIPDTLEVPENAIIIDQEAVAAEAQQFIDMFNSQMGL